MPSRSKLNSMSSLWMAVFLSLALNDGAAANPITPPDSQDFEFRLAGFTLGGEMHGTFSGQDLDGNGVLSSLEGELSGFSLHFSGNSAVPAFHIGLEGLDGLVYVLDGGPLGDDDDPLNDRGEGIRARIGDVVFVIGPGPDETALRCAAGEVACFFVGEQRLDGSVELMQVSPRPAPLSVPVGGLVWSVLLTLWLILGWRAMARPAHRGN